MGGYNLIKRKKSDPEPIKKSTNILDSTAKNVLENMIKDIEGKRIQQLQKSISDLKTRFDTKIDEDKMKKGMECISNESCFNV